MQTTTPDRTVALSKLLNKSHENKWVAIAQDYPRAIAVAATLRELYFVSETIPRSRIVHIKLRAFSSMPQQVLETHVWDA
jgi:hypothetical protein